MYHRLMGMSGEKCYTLTTDNPAEMYVDDSKITIIYPSGNQLEIPRGMVLEAIIMLIRQRSLTVEDIHEKITHRQRACTDRLMAVLRKIPGVTFDKRPRVLYYKPEESG
jgi:hypothetical protein